MSLSNETPFLVFLLLSVVFVAIAGLLSWLVAPALVICAVIIFAIQWLAFVPSALLHNEKAFDAVGSVTYLVVMAYSLLQGTAGARQIVVTALVTIWAIRLGSFLFLRIKSRGSDGRFDKIKVYPSRFFNVWTLQGLWVFLTAYCALIINTSPTADAPIGILDFVGISVWIVGFSVEAISDWQKSRFNSNPHNRGRFITSGFWATSRHPNYFGEIVLWIGIFLIGAGVFSGWQWLGVLSPVFVYLLLTRASGIPILEARADQRWGDDPAYQAYKKKVSILIPIPDPDDGAYVHMTPDAHHDEDDH